MQQHTGSSCTRRRMCRAGEEVAVKYLPRGPEVLFVTPTLIAWTAHFTCTAPEQCPEECVHGAFPLDNGAHCCLLRS